MTQAILVAGVGNIFFSDDGFGPEVVRRLAARRRPGPDVRVVDYGIRGMHLAYDLLDGYRALVIVDLVSVVSGSSGDPGSLTVLRVGKDDLADGEFDAHGMNPVSVLANLEALGGELPPTYVVGCRPSTVEDGIGLSGPVAAAVDEAVEIADRLVDDLLAPTSAAVGDR